MKAIIYLFLITVFFIFVCPDAKAQLAKTNKQDVVYLKNGGVMRGKILERKEGLLKLETRDKNVWVYGEEEVSEVKKETRAFFQKNQGYLNYLEIGILAGNNNNNSDFFDTHEQYASFQLRYFQGYRILPLFAAGITTGVDFYLKEVLLPVALSLRGDLTRSKVTPVYVIESGYGFGWLNRKTNNLTFEGGWLFNAALGLKIHTLSSTSFVMSMGFQSQHSRIKNIFSPDNQREIVQTYKRLTLRFGMSF